MEQTARKLNIHGLVTGIALAVIVLERERRRERDKIGRVGERRREG